MGGFFAIPPEKGLRSIGRGHRVQRSDCVYIDILVYEQCGGAVATWRQRQGAPSTDQAKGAELTSPDTNETLPVRPVCEILSLRRSGSGAAAQVRHRESGRRRRHRAACRRLERPGRGGRGLLGEVGLVVANVLAHAYFHRSFLWADEVARLALSILAFIGGAVAYRRRGHAFVRIGQSGERPRRAAPRPSTMSAEENRAADPRGRGAGGPHPRPVVALSEIMVRHGSTAPLV
jgi:Tripartite ATP-independent periplasmic transporters, DctQ component